MQTMSTTTCDTPANGLRQNVAWPFRKTEYSINPMTLVNLDVGMFKSLLRLGASRECICSVLSISPMDFDYIEHLSAV
jgi:hypothetical protein